MKVKIAMAATLFAVAAMAQQGARTVSSENQSSSDVKVDEVFGDRDLKIIEVHDKDGDLKTEPWYGRIYYVEKKGLVFYVFDLRNIKSSGAVFQAWAYRPSNEEKTESLGVFCMDDASQNRWVLKVSDPRLLEHLDALFVTMEDDPKGSTSPRGQRIMAAKLAGLPNPS